MKRLLPVLAGFAVLFGPALALVGVGLLVSPAAGYCLSTTTGVVATVPDSLAATAGNGAAVTLNRTQLTRARTIILVGTQVSGVTTDGILVALMAALTESSLRQLANSAAYPDSASYPNDGEGADHDSLGLFQMRPASGWGTVAELMDPEFQARAFYGGPSGPNYPSPRGLLDIPDWQTLPLGSAAQAVEVSAFPDRYENFEPVARAILAALTTTSGSTGAADEAGQAGTVPETTQVVFPLPEGTWVATDPFGPRDDPITGAASFHTGQDLAAPAGTTILAAADGIVRFAGMDGDTGTIVIEHTVGGQQVTTLYAHMWPDGINVTVGQAVTAGQPIGQVGSSGHSTGPHLHFEVHPGTSRDAPIDPVPWLAAHGAGQITDPGAASATECRSW